MRTVRRDVERLRRLGYPVHATSGVAGGYRLGAGAALPPLLLDEEEAVAVAVGLRTAASGGVAGIEETSVRALAKLEQVLPTRLRRRVNAVASATVAHPGFGPTVDAQTLVAIASACRDHERLRFGYRSHEGGASRRIVEPHRLVHTRRRWYLVAWDSGRQDWRTFRVDRIAPHPTADRRFSPREPPAADIADYVARLDRRAARPPPGADRAARADLALLSARCHATSACSNRSTRSAACSANSVPTGSAGSPSTLPTSASTSRCSRRPSDRAGARARRALHARGALAVTARVCRTVEGEAHTVHAWSTPQATGRLEDRERRALAAPALGAPRISWKPSGPM